MVQKTKLSSCFHALKKIEGRKKGKRNEQIRYVLVFMTFASNVLEPGSAPFLCNIKKTGDTSHKYALSDGH